TQGEQGFRRVRLEFLRAVQSTFRRVTPSSRDLGAVEDKRCVLDRKSRPGKRKIGVKLHRLLIKTDGFPQGIERQGTACLKSQSAQISIVSLLIVCRFNR